MEMEPEDGLLFICDVDDDINVIAFTPFCVECLKEVIEVHTRDLQLNHRSICRI